MELNNLEKDFRNKLNQREIQPSEKAWDRLDAMLSVAEKKKPKRTWMYIAASFLGFLLVGTIFFNQSKTEQGESQNQIVLENKTENKLEQEKIIETPFVQKQEVIASNEIHQSKESHQTQKSIKNEQVNYSVSEKSPKHEMSFQDLKAQEVALQIMELGKSGKEVSDQEIDNLLEKAKQDIVAQRLFNKTTKKVDATALLLDAEKGLDNSFKQRVFDLLKDGYKETKTFIAERNN